MRRLLIATFAVLAGVTTFANPATAATFTVDSFGDAADGGTNGVCAAPTAGNRCTIRAALSESAASVGADTITVPAGDYQLDPGLNELSITVQVTIAGAGARTTRIIGGAGDRVISINGAVTVKDLTITGGNVSSASAIYGGGVLVSGGDVTLERVSVRGNTVTSSTNAYGGGIATTNNASASLTLLDSTVSGNTAYGMIGATGGYATGGGIYVGSPATIRRTTVSGNAARAGATLIASGGGLALSEPSTLDHVTVAGNTANIIGDTSGSKRGGGIIVKEAMSIGGSIFAGNSAGNGTNCFVETGSVTESAKNLIDDADVGGGACFGAAKGTLKNANPQLGALADNGGPTDTVLPAVGSPAVNAATSCGTRPADQRGNTPLPAGGACDLGAVELGADRGVTLQASKTSAAAGQDVVLTATVTNGPTGDHATGETATIELPAGVTATTATSTLGTCTTGATVTCTLGTLQRGAGATITAVVTANGSNLAITARRSGPVPDPTAGNDAASVSIAGLSGGSGAPGPGGSGDTTAPTLSALKLAKKPTLKKGATLRFTLSEVATVKIVVEQERPGRRKGAKCVAGRTSGKRCTAYKLVKVRTSLVQPGAASIKLPKSALKAAKLRFTVTATDAAGNVSKAATVRGTVKKK